MATVRQDSAWAPTGQRIPSPECDAARVPDTVTIDPRFNGPPDSGNGGYSCGMLARFVDGTAEVTLRRPPPIGRPLAVERRDDGSAALMDETDVVAEAMPVEIPTEAPSPVPAAEASFASEHSPFLEEAKHPFPTCFVCGPRRAVGDGMRIFTGPLGDGEVCAAAWTPSADLAADDGTVREEFVWAALDCPTCGPVWNDPDAPEFRPCVLARLAVRPLAPVTSGRPHTIVTWRIAVDGRKRHSGAALYDEAGTALAVARALWIELKPTS
jgi:hypothetical protein